MVVDVPDWLSWLSVMWCVYATFSKGSLEGVMRHRYQFLVEFDYRLYRTFVVYDVESCGLRYGMGE